MPLVSFNREVPVYAMMTGGSNSTGSSTTNLFQFSETFVASNGITRNSASRVTVSEHGFYELICNLSVLVISSSSVKVQIQKGINGSFSTEGETPIANTVQSFSSSYKFVFELNKDDYIELRSTVSGGSPSANITRCFFGSTDNIFATTTIKKLR